MQRILIVEDDEVTAKVYETLLQRDGFEVQVAPNGEQALEIMQRTGADLVLLDLMLPKLPGTEVLKQIRANPATCTVPVIVFTNAILVSMVKAARQAGATECVTKADCSQDRLLEIVRNALPKKESQNNPADSLVAPAITEEAPMTAQHSIPALPLEKNTPASIAQPSFPEVNPFAAAASVASPIPVTSPIPVVSPMPATSPTPVVSPIPAASPAPSASSMPATPSTSGNTGVIYRTDLRQAFYNNAPEVTTALRLRLPVYVKNKPDADYLPQLFELYHTVHGITSNAGIAGLSRTAYLASALEALLKELFEEPESLNPSSIRTISHAGELLVTLLERGSQPGGDSMPSALILVVDDEIVSRRTITAALEMTNLKAISVDSPDMALRLCQENQFNLIFSDVEMPGKNGFELCTEIRALPNNKTTPVVFITSLSSFDNRARSVMSGGSDFIAKPFLLTELSVKALTYLIKQQLKSGGA